MGFVVQGRRVGGFRDWWECVLGWFSIASLAVLHLLGLGRKVLDLGLAEDDVAAVWAQRLVLRFGLGSEISLEVFVYTGTTMQAQALVREKWERW